MALVAHRYFSENPQQAEIAMQLLEYVGGLPLVSPFGHISADIFADPDYRFRSPVDLLVTSDPSVYRMLHSAGAALEQLGIPSLDGSHVESDPRTIWQLFSAHYYLFRGTPTHLAFEYQLDQIFGVDAKLNSKNAQDIYDMIDGCLQLPEFQPRELFKSFNIELLCTHNNATDSLQSHQDIHASDWRGRILPTFCPQDITEIDRTDWHDNIKTLSNLTGIDIHNYDHYLRAIEMRRAFFRLHGAVATQHTVITPNTSLLTHSEADAILQRALKHASEIGDAPRFTAHMLHVMARMSCDDGMVMQLHSGILPNYDPTLYNRFGRNHGVDIPLWTEFTRNLKPILDSFGNHPNFSLVLFTQDETTYSRELAPLAGHYPSIKVGSPWGFSHSINAISRYFNQVIETAGLYNTVGYVDDSSSLCSIPSRHDVWRRVTCDWLAKLVVECQIDIDDAYDMARGCAYDLVKLSYNL
jgi:glucuronate isomerase